jgi:hypothetical protein
MHKPEAQIGHPGQRSRYIGRLLQEGDYSSMRRTPRHVLVVARKITVEIC